MSKHRTTESVERLASVLAACDKPVDMGAVATDAATTLRDLAKERDALRARLDEAEARMAEIWNIETSDMKDLSDFGIGHAFRRAFNRARTIARAFLNGGGNG